MVTIIQGFRQPSPIAEGIRNVAQTMFGDRLGAGLRQAQFDRLQQDLDLKQREQETKESLAQSLGQSNPEFGNAILGGIKGQDLANFNLLRAAGAAAAGGGDLLGNRDLNAAQLGAGASAGSTGFGFREGEANQSARSREAANISAGASIQGARIRAAQEAQDAAARLAFDRERLGSELVEGIDAVTGQPAFRPRSAVNFQFQPALPDTEVRGARLNQNFGRLGELPLAERTALSAAPSETEVRGAGLQQVLPNANLPELPEDAARNAILGNSKAPNVVRLRDSRGNSFVSTDGGLTDNVTGEPIPRDAVEIKGVTATDLAGAGIQPTTANKTAVVNENAQIRGLNDTLGLMTDIAASNPQIFGAGGALRSGIQAATNVASSIDAAFGGDEGFRRAFESATSEALATADPSGRAAIAQRFDPNLDKIDQLYQMALFQIAGALAGQDGRALSDADVRRAEQMLRPPKSLSGSQQTFLNELQTVADVVNKRAAANAERLQGQFNTGSPPGSGAFLPRVQSQADYDQLPSGTQYIHPDGTTRVKQ